MNNSSKQNLIIGANGLIGRNLSQLLIKNNRNWAGTCWKRTGDGLIKLDLTDAEEVKRVFKAVNPDIVYNCANLGGGVDYCESHPEECRAFHLESTINLGNLCLEKNAKLIFISTDYVYDDRPFPVSEDDAPHPLNVYGKVKLEAEQWIQNNMIDYLIIRTTNVYGWDPYTITPNYLMNLYKKVQTGIFSAPSYLNGTPTYVVDLVQILLALADSNTVGLFHVVGPELITRYDWAIKACEFLDLELSRLIRISEPPDNGVPRPMRLSLSTAKIEKLLGISLHNVDDGLKLMKSDMHANRE